MARPKGSKNKPKASVESLDSLDNLNAAETVESAEVDDNEDSSITPLEEFQHIGLSTDRFGYRLYERPFYKNGHMTSYPVKGGGMATKNYPPGSYGNWDKQNPKFFRTLEGVYNFVRNDILKTKIRNKAQECNFISVKDVLKMLKETREETKILNV